MRRRILIALQLGLIVTLAAGCQIISGSIESISDSVVGIGNSISGSSQGLLRSSGLDTGGSSFAEEDSYRQDVRLATRSFVESGDSDDDFLRSLGRIASTHGVSHWEALPGTYVAIGAGLQQAGVQEPDVAALLTRLRIDQENERALALEGYRAASL